VSRLRHAPALLVALWITASPAWHQVLGQPKGPVRAWTMFRGYGVGTCLVAFETAGPDGERQVLDRFSALGTSPAEAPPFVRRLHGLDSAERLGRRLCRSPESQGSVYLDATCATRDGWRVRRRGKRDLCQRTP